MEIAGIVLGLLIAAFLAVIVIAQIRREGRAREKQKKDRGQGAGRKQVSHEKAKDREWWI